MARTKKDYLEHARSAAIERYRRLDGLETDNPSSNEGNANAGADVWPADAGHDSAIESAVGSSGQAEFGSQGNFRPDQSDVGLWEPADPGEYGEGSSGDGTDGVNGEYYIPIRTVGADSSQRVELRSLPTRRTVKRRSTIVDKVASTVSSVIPTTSKQKTVVQKLLTVGEITHNRPILIKMLLWSSRHMDDGISAITRGHREVEIWSNIEYADAEILVDAFQEAGQKSLWVAERARQIVVLQSKLQAGVILVPRVYRTIVYMFTTGISINW